MNIKIKVKMNSTNKILKDHGLDRDGRVIRQARDTADRLMMPFIPGGAGGQLAKLKTYPNNHSIKYISPYAHYQYTGLAMVAQNGSAWAKKGEKKHYSGKKLKYHTSGTGAKWDRLMLQRRGTELIRDLQSYIKSGQGNKGKNSSITKEIKGIAKTIKNFNQKPEFIKKSSEYAKKFEDFGKNK